MSIRQKLGIALESRNVMLYLLYANIRIGSSRRMFSQTGEDEILLPFLQEEKGTYVDVGAGEPVRRSNTYFLYKRGWSGTCIDPIKTHVTLHQILRPRDLQKRVVIGEVETEIEFYEMKVMELSTSILDRAQGVERDNTSQLKRVFKIKQTTLASICLPTTPISPSLLSIDVEGSSLEVLNSINWQIYKPRVICVEYENEDRKQIENLLSSQNYELKGQTNLSLIWVHSEWLTLNAVK